jgi:hypothetical protein
VQHERTLSQQVCESLFSVAVSPIRRASSGANFGGVTPLRRAQASRSASEWQQHDRQHWSAVAQPHRHDSQGNRSVDRLATETSGKGMPIATHEYTTSTTPAVSRRGSVGANRNLRCIERRMAGLNQKYPKPLI